MSMNPEQYQQLRKLFESALACEQSQRAGFLDDVCGDDTKLRAQLESLLADQGVRSRSLVAEGGRSGDPSVRKVKSKIRLPKRIAG